MKTILRLLFLVLFSAGMEAVAQEAEKDSVYRYAEQLPQYGEDLYKYISKSIQYPADAKELNIEGMVYLQFIIEKDGTISDIVVTKSVYKSIDEEAIRVVKAMKPWKPAMDNGKPIRLKFTLPIRFRLD